PAIAFVVTIALLAIVFPQTLVRTPIFADSIQLPVTLLNFGLVAFVFACVGQEFIKGNRVRMRQTGSNAMTSLFGLILGKRRKYGGYIVHLAVALMFVGFAGKSFETMKDFTVSAPGEAFQVREYTFVYDQLHTETTENKTAVT